MYYYNFLFIFVTVYFLYFYWIWCDLIFLFSKIYFLCFKCPSFKKLAYHLCKNLFLYSQYGIYRYFLKVFFNLIVSFMLAHLYVGMFLKCPLFPRYLIQENILHKSKKLKNCLKASIVWVLFVDCWVELFRIIKQRPCIYYPCGLEQVT